MKNDLIFRMYLTAAGLMIFLSATPQQNPGTTLQENQFNKPRYAYFIHPTLSNLAGKSANDEPNSLSIHLLSAYKFMNGLSVGAGSGIEHLGKPMLPAYGYLRYDLRTAGTTPYVWIKAGYGFSLESEDTDDPWYISYRESKGGMLFNAGIGIALFSRKNLGVNMGVGYRYQKVSTTYHETSWGGEEETIRQVFTEFNRFELQIGVVFR